MERRNFLKSIGIVTAAAYTSPELLAGNTLKYKNMESEALQVPGFPALPYAYDALEPHIDARTMEIHYDKHFRAYHTNFVGAVKGTPAETMNINEIFSGVSKLPEAVRNNGGGYYNHLLFWNNMNPVSGSPSSELKQAIDTTFGSLDKFKETFNNAAKARFGSGWAWLYFTQEKKLAVGSTPNQDNTLMDISPIKGVPLLTLDVWEHAYYLKYQNLRADYINAFWNVVNWQEVNNRYQQALKM